MYFVGYHITPAAALVEPEFNRFVGAALRPSYRGGTWFESTAAHPDVSEPPGDDQKSATGPTCRAAGTVRSPYTLRKYGALHAARVGSAAGVAHGSAYSPGHAYSFGLARVLDGLSALIDPAKTADGV